MVYSVIIRILGYGLLLAILLVVYIKHLEHHSVFFPDREITGTPAAFDLPYREHTFTSENGLLLQGWFIRCPGAEYTFFLCHGNAGNISHRLDKIKILHEAGVNVFLFDYRGYGRSQGVPTEGGVYQDAEYAYRYVTGALNIPEKRIVIHGTSLGGAVAVDLAQKVDAAGLIVESSFSSGRDMAQVMYPFIPKVLFADMFDSLAKIKKIDMPVLFLHSREDEAVPFAFGRKLYDAVRGPKEFVEISGGHDLGFLQDPARYKKALVTYLARLSQKR
ncbi:MAG: alpha/beta hydrolase [Candidatus Omnitrophica bacterium]|nr:alpha/beta hydrolase [Candidatus Omnitrophota bacterium]